MRRYISPHGRRLRDCAHSAALFIRHTIGDYDVLTGAKGGTKRKRLPDHIAEMWALVGYFITSQGTPANCAKFMQLVADDLAGKSRYYRRGRWDDDVVKAAVETMRMPDGKARFRFPFDEFREIFDANQRKKHRDARRKLSWTEARTAKDWQLRKLQLPDDRTLQRTLDRLRSELGCQWIPRQHGPQPSK